MNFHVIYGEAILNKYGFTNCELPVAKLMMEGKSNKQIASILKISVSTVEFHLTRIYAKLGVSSRSEAIILIGHQGESLVLDESDQGSKTGESSGKSLVENAAVRTDNEIESSPLAQTNLKMNLLIGKIFGKHTAAISIIIIITIAAIAVYISIFFLTTKSVKIYERECEHPDSFSVGLTIDRSNASGKNVHGQFGSMNTSPWSSQAGFAIYQNILIPKEERIYLKINFSKKSPSSVPIQIFLDDEEIPIATFFPVDQGDWNHFEWSDPIFLGSVEKGVHSIKFWTDGEQYGVADLDKFVLMAESP